MTDKLTPEQRRKAMQSIHSKDTSIERCLRNALWEKGYRYRKNYKAVPGKPDIAITKYRIAIFCDSEFFHGKDWKSLKLQLAKGNRSEFWISKIQKNRERDERINRELTDMGWTVLRFWGRDILKNTDICVQAVDEAVIEAIIESKNE